MSLREVPEARGADAGLLAAMLGLVPVRRGGRIELLSRREVRDRAEECRSRGEDDRAHRLLADLDFDGDGVFQRTFSQMASESVRVRTSTLYRMLERMAETGESRNDLLRRVLGPVIARELDELSDRLDEGKREMLRYSLKEWTGAEQADREEAGPFDFRAGPAEPALPALRTTLSGESMPPDVRKYSRYFLKNLFRLNNLHGDREFFYPPEVVEDYWEVVAPDQGAFVAELCPAMSSFVLALFDPSRRFGLQRTDNPDYFGLVEMLALEHRKGRIKGCRVNVRGATLDDDIALKELLSIETHLPDDAPLPYSVRLPEELSPAGLAAFRRGLRELSGIRAEVLFPVNAGREGGAEDFTTLGFDIKLDKDTGRFVLDGAVVSEATAEQVALAVGAKLLALSRRLYRDPPRFPEPDVDELERRVRGLMDRAEKEGLSEATAREIVATITVLDYYESLEKYSHALGESIASYLEGTQAVTFAIPKVLRALLDLALEDRSVDDMLLDGLRAGGA